ncbi:PHP domain-containing protein [Synechococcus sp. CS-1328]|uniref:PHP domain-containing protein n=1 Tax=Synechococcus sp. CS-1328 TaxID=2847976 RepID=UPI00223C1189|nr:PHP domain-containing protein [Synechococcus sp. CS-1328]MCT0226356.1 PHP domain-containing protein [Synechococcus sp. CS-1328]
MVTSFPQLRPEAATHPLARVLRTVSADSCPGRLNFHCHTTCSDGSLHPRELARQAAAIGLQHFAVTDHHAMAAYPQVLAALNELASDGLPVPTLWSGVEISCLLEGCLVHVLALGFTPDHPALAIYLRGEAVVGPALRSEAVVAAIRAAGGLALLAHPARYRLSHQRLLTASAAQGFDGAEAWYDYAMQGRWAPTPLVCEAIAAALAERGLLQSCGTDTHGLELRGR